MTPDRADVAVLQEMIDSMVGIPKFSYPARQQDAKKPAIEFAHIRVLEEYQEGIPVTSIKSQTDTTTTSRTYSLARLRCRIGVVETTGIPSSKIMHGWTSEAMKEIMIRTGYGFISCKPVSSEDALLEKFWEYRKGFSVELYVTRVYEETVDNITSMIISGDFITDTLDTVSLNININN